VKQDVVFSVPRFQQPSRRCRSRTDGKPVGGILPVPPSATFSPDAMGGVLASAGPSAAFPFRPAVPTTGRRIQSRKPPGFHPCGSDGMSWFLITAWAAIRGGERHNARPSKIGNPCRRRDLLPGPKRSSETTTSRATPAFPRRRRSDKPPRRAGGSSDSVVSTVYLTQQPSHALTSARIR